MANSFSWGGELSLIGADAVHAALPFSRLVPALEAAFRGDGTVPERQHLDVDTLPSNRRILLLMPAWNEALIGVKLVTVTFGNPAKGLSTINSLYCLFDSGTGIPVALIDGTALTLRRTAAASALAAQFLARPDASSLVLIGTGALAPYMAAAHASVRPLRDIAVAGRDASKTAALVARLQAEGLPARSCTDLDKAVAAADIVSCATTSKTPVFKGRLVKAGAHVDLVGAFTPDAREADDDLVGRARIFVDTRAGALSEAGDLLQPLASGVIDRSAILGDLNDLCRGGVPMRAASDVTMFKSVGASLEDLAGAALIWRTVADPARAPVP